MNVRAALPLFPLGTVLYPDGLLVLKIFEARYLDLMSRCMRDASAFGVVALKQGTEVGRQPAGETVELHGTGTLAHLIDVDAPTTGILHVRCRGGRRFGVAAPRQQADGLWLADASERADAPVVEPGPAYAHLRRSLEEAIAALAAKGAAPFLEPHRFESAGWIADRWCELLPLAVDAKQLLLEEDDPLKRLAIVDTLLQRMRDA